MTLPMMANNPGCSENSQQKNEVFVKYNKKKIALSSLIKCTHAIYLNI
jgi:hypothetical protein